MSPHLPANHGQRPSLLTLGRELTGESAPDPGHADAREVLSQAVRESAPPAFDWAVLQAAAARVTEPAPPPRAVPWWRRAWPVWVPLLAVAGALFVVRQPGVNRVKGDVELEFLTLREGVVQPGVDGQPLREGDRVQFRYRSGGHADLVLLSVDGEGTVTVFYPARGDEPEPIVPGSHVLEGSIVLDDAVGPETFLAVFGAGSVAAASELVEEAYRAGGHSGLARLEQSDPAVAAIHIQKVP